MSVVIRLNQDWVLVQPRPEDRSGEWFCHPARNWDNGDYTRANYCPEFALALLSTEGQPVVRYDLGPFPSEMGADIYLSTDRHIPYTLNRNNQPIALRLETLQSFVSDSPMRYIGYDGVEYQYSFSPSDHRFVCRNLSDPSLSEEILDCTEVLLQEFSVSEPDGIYLADADGEMEDELSNPITGLNY